MKNANRPERMGYRTLFLWFEADGQRQSNLTQPFDVPADCHMALHTNVLFVVLDQV